MTEEDVKNGNVSKLPELVADEGEEKIAIIAYDEDIEYISRQIPKATLYSFGSKQNKHEQAQLLFFTLREIDKKDFDVIFAPLPDKEGIGLALYNRMIRAAAHMIINLRR